LKLAAPALALGKGEQLRFRFNINKNAAYDTTYLQADVKFRRQ
jgi:hypothetical protein